MCIRDRVCSVPRRDLLSIASQYIVIRYIFHFHCIRDARTCQAFLHAKKPPQKTLRRLCGLKLLLVGSGVVLDSLHRQADALAVIVDVRQFDFDFLTDAQHVGDLLNTLVGDLGDVNQTVDTRQDAQMCIRDRSCTARRRAAEDSAPHRGLRLPSAARISARRARNRPAP